MKILARLKSLRSKWTVTEYKACRTCGMTFFIFAMILVLPLLLNFLFSSELRRASGILGFLLLIVFGVTLGTAIMSAIAGKTFFSKAARIRKTPDPNTPRHCGYALLGLSLLILVPLFSTMLITNIQPFLPFHMPSSLVSPLKIFSSGVYLLAGGLMSWQIAGRILFGVYILVLMVFGLVSGAIAIALLRRNNGEKKENA